jgi:hypothetical protein
MKVRFVSLFCSAVALVGCGKLSKDQARQIIQTTYYDKDDNAYCAWSPGDRHRKDPPTVLSFVSQDAQPCVKELAAAGVLTEKDKPKPVPYELGGGTLYSYTLAGSAYYAKDGNLQVPCGKKKLGEVVSVSSEGTKATVKYTRTFTMDAALLGKISDCELTSKPTPGDSTETMRFRRDDDGKWAPDY